MKTDFLSRVRNVTLSLLLGGGLLIALFLLVSAPGPALAIDTIYCVHPSGDDAHTCTCDVADYCRSVQRAVEVATDGDTIWVAGGDYAWSSVPSHGANGLVDVTESVLILGGWDDGFENRDPWTYESRLDAEGNDRVLYIAGDVSPTVDGFTIVGGNAGGDYGGGIYASGAHPIIANSVISGNRARHGAGLALQSCTNYQILTATIRNNGFSSPTADEAQGGGIYLNDADGGLFRSVDLLTNSLDADIIVQGGGGYLYASNDVTFRDVLISGNWISGSVEVKGGGLYNDAGHTLHFAGVTIRDNAAQAYGGIYSLNTNDVEMSDFTVAGNVATQEEVGGLYLSGSPITLSYGLILSNSAPSGEYGGVRLVGDNVTLLHVSVLSNVAYGGYGGLALQGAGALLSHVTVQGNWAGDDATADHGGVYLSGQRATLDHVIVTGNYAQDDSGGLYLNGDFAALRNITVTYNIADGANNESGGQRAGGVYLQSGPVTLTNGFIAYNQGRGSSTRANYGGLYLNGPNGIISNVIVMSNTTTYQFGGAYVYGAGARLSRVTAVNNTAASFYGGIYLYGSGAVLEDLLLRGNRAPTTTTSLGGGLYLSGFDNGILRRSVIAGNQAQTGGGVYIAGGSGYRLENNWIADNRAGGDGSGAYLAGSGTLAHHTVAQNEGGSGQGLYLDGNFVMTNSIVASHTVGASVDVSGSLALYYSDFWGNDTPYEGPVDPVEGNRSCDPLFLDPAHGDYHIGPDPGPDPCVLDQALPLSGVADDVERDPRPNGPGPDIGCDEFFCTIEAAWLMDPPTPRVGEAVTFEGVAQAVFPPFTLEWDFGDGETATGRVVTHTYSSIGTYQATLTITNECGQTVLTRTIQVMPPSVDVGVSGAGILYRPASPIPLTETVVLTGFVEAGTGPIDYAWSLGDGSSAGGRAITHTYNQEGVYVVVMTATNDVYGSPAQSVASETLVLFVGCRPVEMPGFAINPPTPQAGEPAWFQGWVVTGTPPIDISWDLGDGELDVGPVISHTYNSDGFYTILMTAANQCGESTLSRRAYVAPVGICLPVESAGIHHDPLRPRVGEEVHFIGYALTGTSPLSYTWEFGDGEGGSGWEVAHSYTASGQYMVEVAVENPCGADEGMIWLQVLPPEGEWGVSLEPNRSGSAPPGTLVTYTHILRNTGTMSDSYSLVAASSQGWPLSLSGETFFLPPQAEATLTVTVEVPIDASPGITDVTQITATSQTDGAFYGVALDRTTVSTGEWRVYLPLVMRAP